MKKLIALVILLVTPIASAQDSVFTKISSLVAANNELTTSGTYLTIDLDSFAGVTYGSQTDSILRVGVKSDSTYVNRVSFLFSDSSTTSTQGTTALNSGIVLEDGEVIYVRPSKRYLHIAELNDSLSTTTVRVDYVSLLAIK